MFKLKIKFLFFTVFFLLIIRPAFAGPELVSDPYDCSNTECPKSAVIYSKCGNETSKKILADNVILQPDYSIKFDLGKWPVTSCEYSARYKDKYGRLGEPSDPFVLKSRPKKPLNFKIPIP